MTRQTGHDIAAGPRRRTFGMTLFRYRLLAFLAVLGPGFVTANVDNDPGGILTYSQAGAHFGYTLLWTLVPTTIALIVVQEMAARMGVATGKGLSDLIREEFGLRLTFFTMAVLTLADLGNIVAEFAGIASGMGVFGVSKYICVPAGAALVWFVIVRGTYRPVERLLLVFSLIYFAYPVSAFLAHPDWGAALKDTVVPRFSADPEYIAMIVGLIGTTIT
ncbi:MAG TPA: Nramp family divalent metal transporter, partial [Bryobacteraceae bacterium]